jgi:hypothetical protein
MNEMAKVAHAAQRRGWVEIAKLLGALALTISVTSAAIAFVVFTAIALVHFALKFW